MNRKPVISVVGAGNATDANISNAKELGRLVAENGWVLVTGGRNAGVMKDANKGAKEAGGLTIGILPNRETDISPDVDVAIITEIGEARNNIIVLSADIVIACGVEDPGTASEVALAIKAMKHVIVLGESDEAKEFFLKIGPGLVHPATSPSDAIYIAKGLTL